MYEKIAYYWQELALTTMGGCLLAAYVKSHPEFAAQTFVIFTCGAAWMLILLYLVGIKLTEEQWEADDILFNQIEELKQDNRKLKQEIKQTNQQLENIVKNHL